MSDVILEIANNSQAENENEMVELSE